MKIIHDEHSVTVSQLTPAQVDKLLTVVDNFVEDLFKIKHTSELPPEVTKLSEVLINNPQVLAALQRYLDMLNNEVMSKCDQ